MVTGLQNVSVYSGFDMLSTSRNIDEDMYVGEKFEIDYPNSPPHPRTLWLKPLGGYASMHAAGPIYFCGA